MNHIHRAPRVIALIVTMSLAVGAVAAACSSSGNKAGPTVTVTETAAPSAATSDNPTEAGVDPTSTDQASAASSDTPTGPPATEAIESIKWVDGADGAAPTLEFDKPLDASGVAAKVISPGDGEEVKAGMIIRFDHAETDMRSGEVVSNSYDKTAADSAGEGALVLDEAQAEESLLKALVGQKVGADVMYVMQSGLSGDAAAHPYVSAITILGVGPALEKATGTALTPSKSGLPAVKLADSGEPSITAEKGDPPSELVAEVLIKGSGEAIKEGQAVAFHYSGWLWDGTEFDSSWTRGQAFATIMAKGAMIDGWINGLVGQTIGSQVLLVIPPDLAYGSEGAGDMIPPDSTLVFVVDILGAA